MQSGASNPPYDDLLAARFLRLACSNQVGEAAAMLESQPALSGFDVFTAAACGDLPALGTWLGRDPGLARASGGPQGRPAIVYACFSRFLRADPRRAADIVAAVRLLLAHGADPNGFYWAGDGADSELQTCIYGAAGIANHAGLTRVLLEAGAKVDQRDNEVLYHAAEFEDVTCLALVLQAGADPAKVTYCLGRALDFDNQAAALLFLQHGADPNFRVPWAHNRSHMHKAAINGRSGATVTAMLDAGGDFTATDALGGSAHRYAVRGGFDHLVQLFEARGADPAAASVDDRAQGAVLRGQPVTLPAGFVPDPHLAARAAAQDDVAALARLLDAGADVNGGAGMPLLHNAAWGGNLAALKLLLARGARLGLVNEFGGTEIGAAVHGSSNCFDKQGGVGMKLPEEITHGDYVAVVEQLIAAGAALPAVVHEGSVAVRALLRRHGVRCEEASP